jgi:mannose/fructose-specific phosphotransferase system component IIA
MSDAQGAVGIVVGHGGLSQGLIDAVRRIAGDAADCLTPLSNEDKGPDELRAELDRIVGDQKAVVFVDLRSGSCGMAAQACCRDSLVRVVVCGVNLPMLLDFVFSREVPLEELAPHLAETGRNAIASITGA